MKMDIILLFAFVISVSCNQQKPTTTSESLSEDTTLVKISDDVLRITCYEKISNQDTFRLRVEAFEGRVTGTLAYLFHEKDSNMGDYEGRMYGDTLIADYIFTSEGSTSVRQVAFRINGQTATEGYGEMKEQDGKMSFSDWRTLAYGQGVIMSRHNCPEG
jgi:hypothetical protein